MVGVAGLELCIRRWPILALPLSYTPVSGQQLHSAPRMPNITYLLVITAITDTVTPGSWRGFVQDFLKPMRLV